jgi:hypothetical protein
MRCPEVQFGCENSKNGSVKGFTTLMMSLTGTATPECAIVALAFYTRGAMIRTQHPVWKTNG